MTVITPESRVEYGAAMEEQIGNYRQLLVICAATRAEIGKMEDDRHRYLRDEEGRLMDGETTNRGKAWSSTSAEKYARASEDHFKHKEEIRAKQLYHDLKDAEARALVLKIRAETAVAGA